MAVARRGIGRPRLLWLWRYDILHSGLPPRARYLLLVIAHHLRNDDTESVKLSLRQFCSDTGLSKDGVKEGLRQAVESGLLEVVEVEPGYIQANRRNKD